MVLFVLLLIAALGAVAALLKKRVSFVLVLSAQGYRAIIRVLGIKLTFEGAYDRLWYLIGEKENKKNGFKLNAGEVIACFELKRLYAHARIGIKDDAAATAFTCGVLRALFDAAGAAICKNTKLDFDLKPEFDRGMLWIYMEGILVVYPGKLIRMIIGKLIREVMRKWLIRSKTSWRPPWQSSEKWSM